MMSRPDSRPVRLRRPPSIRRLIPRLSRSVVSIRLSLPSLGLMARRTRPASRSSSRLRPPLIVPPPPIRPRLIIPRPLMLSAKPSPANPSTRAIAPESPPPTLTVIRNQPTHHQNTLWPIRLTRRLSMPPPLPL